MGQKDSIKVKVEGRGSSQGTLGGKSSVVFTDSEQQLLAFVEEKRQVYLHEEKVKRENKELRQKMVQLVSIDLGLMIHRDSRTDVILD
jgi:ubiquinone biosynthesis protein COQ9